MYLISGKQVKKITNCGLQPNIIQLIIKINEVKIIRKFSVLKTHLLIIQSVKIKTNGLDLFSYFEVFTIYFEISNTHF